MKLQWIKKCKCEGYSKPIYVERGYKLTGTINHLNTDDIMPPVCEKCGTEWEVGVSSVSRKGYSSADDVGKKGEQIGGMIPITKESPPHGHEVIVYVIEDENYYICSFSKETGFEFRDGLERDVERWTYLPLLPCVG